jgi:hypothetical protein
MACKGQVHVGDVGTRYLMRVRDRGGLDFDPSDAPITKLIFDLPGNGVVTKTATVVGGTMEANAAGELEFVEGGSPATTWCLAYTVEPDAGAGSPPAEFHAEEGLFTMQGYIEWSASSKFHSDEETTDVDGQELRIFPNLD